MPHLDELIDILDQDGNIVGSKPRREVDKRNDIFHGVKIFVCRPDKILLMTQIAEKSAVKNNLFVGLLGATVATMKRSGELAEAAAKRALERELGLTDQTLHWLGEGMYQVDKDITRKQTSFYILTDRPLKANPEDISSLVPLTKSEIEAKLKSEPGVFAPTFVALWKLYSQELPI